MISGFPDQALSRFGRPPLDNHPSHNEATEDVQNRIEIKVDLLRRPLELVDIPGPHLIAHCGHQLRFPISTKNSALFGRYNASFSAPEYSKPPSTIATSSRRSPIRSPSQEPPASGEPVFRTPLSDFSVMAENQQSGKILRGKLRLQSNFFLTIETRHAKIAAYSLALFDRLFISRKSA